MTAVTSIEPSGNVWPLPENAFSNPRSGGTFARFLGRFVREKEILTWPEAIRKITLIPAQLFAATIDRLAQTSEGVRYLLVNGTVLIDEGVLDKNALPGRPIRRTTM